MKMTQKCLLLFKNWLTNYKSLWSSQASLKERLSLKIDGTLENQIAGI